MQKEIHIHTGNYIPCKDTEHLFEIIKKSSKMSSWKGFPLWVCINPNCNKIVEAI